MQIPSFADLSASLNLSLGTRNSDTFNLNVSATLGQTSNGLSPATEDMTVRIGEYSILIPKGSFTGRHPSFHGMINGADIEASVTSVGPRRFEFRLKGQGAHLGGFVLPPEAKLVIGDDGGSSTLLRAEINAESF